MKIKNIFFCKIISLLFLFKYMNSSDFTIKKEFSLDKDKLRFARVLNSKENMEGMKLMNEFFETLNVDDRNMIEEFFSQILYLVLDNKDMKTYFNDNFAFWKNEINTMIESVGNSIKVLQKAQFTYIEDTNKLLKNKQAYTSNLEGYISIDEKLYLINQKSIKSLKEINEKISRLILNTNLGINLFKKIFWLNTFHENKYIIIKVDIQKNQTMFEEILVNQYLSLQDECNKVGVAFSYSINNKIASLALMSKCELEALRKNLFLLKLIFSPNCALDTMDFKDKMMESYLFECFCCIDADNRFKDLMFKYIDAIDDAKNEEKAQLRLRFMNKKEKLKDILTPFMDKLQSRYLRIKEEQRILSIINNLKNLIR